MYVWLNGHFVGYAEDSFHPSEFDLTPYIGKRTICWRWKCISAVRLLFWRIRISSAFSESSGCGLYAKPQWHVEDLWAKPYFSVEDGKGTLDAAIKISAEGEDSVRAKCVYVCRMPTGNACWSRHRFCSHRRSRRCTFGKHWQKK